MAQNSPTFATIVVPLDGSELAEAAIPVAAAIALPSGARINLVTVALTYAVPVDAQIDTLTRYGLKRALADLESRFPGVTKTDLAGDPSHEIVKHANSIDADLIVMATHGRSGFRKLLLGSVADRVITTSSVPVLLVKGVDSDNAPSAASPTLINRIVLSLDGNEPGAEAARYGMELARLLGAETVVVYVDEDGMAEQARRQANEVAGRFDEKGRVANVRELDGAPGPAISEAASEQPHTLVVMSSLSATEIAKGTHRGSVADHVVKHAEALVMVVPARGYLRQAVK